MCVASGKKVDCSGVLRGKDQKTGICNEDLWAYLLAQFSRLSASADEGVMDALAFSRINI